ncbi:MAG TPA: hypothetical protein VFB79_14235 [Candidatus Angelobacter sp.]|nr:hypothetical protein [Candidatus Angelobacter sp.]
MSEIDPQSGDPLVKALRHLAASSQQGAPAEIGFDLAAAFRQHHARRRRVRRISMGGLVTCVAVIAGLFILRTPQTSRTPYPAQNTTQAHIAPANMPAPEAIQTASMPAAKPKPARKLLRPKVTTSTVAYSREFIALPGYDPEVPAEDLHIVRVQLPTSTLWQMGAPINPADPERRVLADFVVSQEGTPYGVRLVHTTSF